MAAAAAAPTTTFHPRYGNDITLRETQSTILQLAAAGLFFYRCFYVGGTETELVGSGFGGLIDRRRRNGDDTVQ